MFPLPALLRRALALCNRFGKPIAVFTLGLGVCIVVTQTALRTTVGNELLLQLHAIVGDERYAEIESQLTNAADAESATTLFMQELENVVSALPAQEQEPYLLALARASLAHIAHIAIPLALVLFILHACARMAFVILAARRIADTGQLLRQTVQRFFPVLGAWIGVWMGAGIWVPAAVFVIGFFWTPVLYLALPSIVPLILLLPRLVFAPVIVAQENLGVLAALKASFARTRGKWWAVFSVLLAMESVVWVVLTVIGMLLAALVTAVTRYSALGYGLYWLTPFFALIAVAYRQAFIVEVKEEMMEK